MKSNLYSKVCRALIETGYCEIRIRISPETTFGELEQKLSLLLSAFSPEDIKVYGREKLF